MRHFKTIFLWYFSREGAFFKCLWWHLDLNFKVIYFLVSEPSLCKSTIFTSQLLTNLFHNINNDRKRNLLIKSPVYNWKLYEYCMFSFKIQQIRRNYCNLIVWIVVSEKIFDNWLRACVQTAEWWHPRESSIRRMSSFRLASFSKHIYF